MRPRLRKAPSREEFLPLSVSRFSSSIDKIQKADHDVLVVLLTGVTQSSFYGQWAAAGMDVPIATTINITQGCEHLRFDPPACANMYVTAQFIEELDTPEAVDFVERFHALYPDEPYVGMEAAAQYTGMMLYAEAVKRASALDLIQIRPIWSMGVFQARGHGRARKMREEYWRYSDRR